jgi:hypothetical protein
MRLAACLLLAGVTALATPPVSAGPYCLPTGGRDQISKTASVCPSGYFSTGRCCQALHPDTRKAFAKLPGQSCPTGSFASSTSYCVSFR